MRINKSVLFSVAIVVTTLGAFGTFTDSALALTGTPLSPRPAQSLGLSVGNLPQRLSERKSEDY